MQSKIDSLRIEIEEALKGDVNREVFKTTREKYLSKKGIIPSLMTELRNFSPEERPVMGKLINEFKVWAEARFDEVEEVIKKAELEIDALYEEANGKISREAELLLKGGE